MALIDVHIGVTPSRTTLNAAISSIQHPQINHLLIHGAKSILELRTRGFEQSTSDYVSFCDDDDVFLNTELIVKEAESGTPAFFTNSWIHDNDRMYSLFRDDFIWTGIQSYHYGFPHNPFVCKRDIMLQAIENARGRILDSDARFHNTGVELAIGFEVELLVGWKYVPMMGYIWNRHNDSTSRQEGQKEIHTEIYNFYKNLI